MTDEAADPDLIARLMGHCPSKADIRAAVAEIGRLTRERDEADKISNMLLSYCASHGDEPDLLVRAWQEEVARADRAAEAFAIAKAKLNEIANSGVDGLPLPFSGPADDVTTSPAGREAEESPCIPSDVARLVVAARIVAFERHDAEALRELDKASEVFAERVPWDDDPDALDEVEALRKALEAAPRPTPPFDPVPYMDWYFKVRIAALAQVATAPSPPRLPSAEEGGEPPASSQATA